MRGVIEHHIVQLGVIVCDTLGNFSACLQVEQDVDERLPPERESDFILGLGRTAVRISLDRSLKGFEPASSMMKERDRLVQSRPRKIKQQSLKFAEGACSGSRLLGGLDDVVRASAFDEKVTAPPTAVRIAMTRLIF